MISSSHDTRRASVNPLDEGIDETFVLLRSETDAKSLMDDCALDGHSLERRALEWCVTEV